jgi:predicted RNA-binding Zn-ribbon protein involved in translation (DUF1610 family)
LAGFVIYGSPDDDKSSEAMSIYRTAFLYSLWVSLVFVTSIFWFSELTRLYGTIGTIAGAVIWLAHGIPAIFYFKCPICGASLYARERTVSLWNSKKISWPPQQFLPNKQCPNCGNDHTSARNP